MRRHKLYWSGLLVALPLGLGLCLAPLAGAQDAPKPPEGQPPKEKPAEAPKRFPDMNELVKDMKPIEGLFTLYRFDPSDKNRDPEKLLCKIPANLINEDLLFATSIASGGNFTGWMWNDALFRWEISGGQLKMRVPDYRWVYNEDKPATEALRRTADSTFIAAVPILSMTPAGDVLIDMSALLKSNIADANIAGGNLRPDLSKWTKVKNFPDNLLIEADLAFVQGLGGSEIGVAYAFQRLPKLGAYKPRLADQRVGYFLTTRVDWTKPSDAREVAERYINRWHLEKRDPSLEVSPPKKPIVFYIEKTVPVQWRRYVREGIEEWNKAFEKIGFVDAVIVLQQTEDNEFKDIDPEDARYNFVRWTMTGRGLAVGPSRADPRTGQLLDADIVVDEGWVRAFLSQFDTYGPTSMGVADGPGLELLMQRYPDFVPELLRPQQRTPAFPHLSTPVRENAPTWRDHRACGSQCQYAEGMIEQIALAHFWMVATGTGKKVPERLIGEALKEVVAHEVGHTLGLRHNFKGSAWLTLEEAKARREKPDEPMVSSVMDYNPLLFFADDQNYENIKAMAPPVIGPYDYWAIEYGYKPAPSGKSEADLLKEIASRCNEPGLAYATDEDTLGAFSPDPFSNRYDMSSDHIAWARSRLELCDKLLSNLNDWAAKDGEPRYYVTQAFNIITGQRARNYDYIARLVGGQTFNRNHKGDPEAKPAFELYPAETQRAALKLLNETLFSDTFMTPNPELLNQLAASRWMDGRDFGVRVDYPIHDRITGLQASILMTLLAPPTLQRIYDAELKTTEANRFTVSELLTTVRDGLWKQLSGGPAASSDAKPMISSIARNLQLQYLNMMLSLAQMPPGSGMSADLSSMVRFSLRELSQRIGATLSAAGNSEGKSKIDFASRSHLAECKSRIDRVLDAQFQAR